jgi:hypothetical protein
VGWSSGVSGEAIAELLNRFGLGAAAGVDRGAQYAQQKYLMDQDRAASAAEREKDRAARSAEAEADRKLRREETKAAEEARFHESYRQDVNRVMDRQERRGEREEVRSLHTKERTEDIAREQKRFEDERYDKEADVGRRLLQVKIDKAEARKLQLEDETRHADLDLDQYKKKAAIDDRRKVAEDMLSATLEMRRALAKLPIQKREALIQAREKAMVLAEKSLAPFAGTPDYGVKLKALGQQISGAMIDHAELDSLAEQMRATYQDSVQDFMAISDSSLDDAGRQAAIDRIISRPPRAEAAPFDEAGFKKWYGGHAKALGLSPNPDDPEHHYDYRAAFKAGAGPDPASGHWPSQFKADDHPNRFVEGVDTKTGQPMTGRDFGDNALRTLKRTADARNDLIRVAGDTQIKHLASNDRQRLETDWRDYKQTIQRPDANWADQYSDFSHWMAKYRYPDLGKRVGQPPRTESSPMEHLPIMWMNP